MTPDMSANSGAACSSHVCNCAAGAALLFPDVITQCTLWLSTRKWHHHLCLPPGSSPGAAQMGVQSHERTSFVCPTTREQEDPWKCHPSLCARASFTFSRVLALLPEEIRPESQKLIHLTHNPLSIVGLSTQLPSPRSNLACAHRHHLFI